MTRIARTPEVTHMPDKPFIRLTALAAAVALDIILFRPAGDPGADAAKLFVFAPGDFAAAIAVQERHNPDCWASPGLPAPLWRSAPAAVPWSRSSWCTAGSWGYRPPSTGTRF